jgi:hypothetical protein
MDTYFTEMNHVLLASRGYEYDGFLDFLNSIVFISLNDYKKFINCQDVNVINYRLLFVAMLNGS